MKTLNCYKIAGSESLAIRSREFSYYQKNYYLNGVVIEDHDHILVVNPGDDLTYCPSDKVLSHYQKGDCIMSIEEYDKFPTYYNDDFSDEEVLRRIANKEHVEGYKKVMVDPTHEKISLDIVGEIAYSSSKFISTSVSSGYSSNPVLYSISGNRVAMDEWEQCKKDYSEHAKFYNDSRRYLTFFQVNYDYVFTRYEPFGDGDYLKTFSSLFDAEDYELKVRKSVRDIVISKVFDTELTDVKKINLLSTLKHISKLKTRKSIVESLDLVIDDLQEYINNCK